LQSRLKRFDVNGKDLVFAQLPVHESPAALGSRLVGAEMLFRHRRPLVNRALRLAAPWFADDPVPMRGAA